MKQKKKPVRMRPKDKKSRNYKTTTISTRTLGRPIPKKARKLVKNLSQKSGKTSKKSKSGSSSKEKGRKGKSSGKLSKEEKRKLERKKARKQKRNQKEMKRSIKIYFESIPHIISLRHISQIFTPFYYRFY